MQENLQKTSEEYRCSKCRDLRYIIENDEAVPCECKSLREAEEILKYLGLKGEFEGEGEIKEQSISAGEIIKSGDAKELKEGSIIPIRSDLSIGRKDGNYESSSKQTGS